MQVILPILGDLFENAQREPWRELVLISNDIGPGYFTVPPYPMVLMATKY